MRRHYGSGGVSPPHSIPAGSTLESQCLKVRGGIYEGHVQENKKNKSSEYS